MHAIEFKKLVLKTILEKLQFKKVEHIQIRVVTFWLSKTKSEESLQ